MIYQSDAERWTGTFVVIGWHVTNIAGRRSPTDSGGRVQHVDETYLYLQPFSLSPKQPGAQFGEPVTRLGLQKVEEKIPLVDIDTILAAPLDGMPVDED